MTPSRYKKIFGILSDKQKEIIEDDKSQYIVIAAGPGSGKTRVLVHKLAALLTLEDIKSEQLLMLTFSRAAAIEFKKRLFSLIGSSAAYVEIKTFHSYCFDILGCPGSLDDSDEVIEKAVEQIKNNTVEASKISKAVLVIDEAQDMSEDEFSLIEALIEYNDSSLRIIAVGDDDQNIYEFRGSDSSYFQSLITKYKATKYEMLENYRSSENIVKFANIFAKFITQRMKFSECLTQKHGGRVRLVKYNTQNLESPIVEDISQFKPKGSTCILTNTNNEALRVLGLLNQKNIPARLIQSLDGFKLIDLQEIRYIIQCIEKSKSIVQISDDCWTKIKMSLTNKFARSQCLQNVLKMLEEFENTNSKNKYISDIKAFFGEAKFEDFYENGCDKITVSTIHKSKGSEYDNVFMLMNNVHLNKDADKRKIYVGITRAKNLLSIYYNNNLFDQFKKYTWIENSYDNLSYDEPEQIILQLSHKDVFLGYFDNDFVQNIIQKRRSGDPLYVKGQYLFDDEDYRIAKFSKACSARINNLMSQGYSIDYVNIRFIVYWKNQEEKELLIILPDIHFKK
jgi:ATP-dependent DNA helicase RecQ